MDHLCESFSRDVGREAEMNNDLQLRYAIKGGSIDIVRRCISEGIQLVGVFNSSFGVRCRRHG